MKEQINWLGMDPELDLDPSDWEASRRLGHRMIDDMISRLRGVRDRPIWAPIPQKDRDALAEPVPMEGMGDEAVYGDFVDKIFSFPSANTHPRFWGWVKGTGTMIGALADFLASGMNPNAGGFDQIATHVEREVLKWLTDLMGFPEQSSGLLVSGGSMANLVGLTVARNAKADYDLRAKGVRGGRPMRFYASAEVHSSVQKALEILGLGHEALRRVAVDDDYRMDLAALKEMIAEDRALGYLPACVIGCAGTVNTGAFDDLNGLADLCQAEDIWLHVDGAFGAWARVADGYEHLAAGMERADSLGFDLHKWMYMPYEVGCVLVRDPEAHRDTFRLAPSYLQKLDGGYAAVPPIFSEYGVELSRNFKALKVWFSLKSHGMDRYKALIKQNIQQAAYLSELVTAEPNMELTAPVFSNLVCFRYLADGLDQEALNQLNADILVALQERGLAIPSSTVLKGRFCLRVAITNHRTRRSDFDLLVREVRKLGRELNRKAVAVA